MKFEDLTGDPVYDFLVKGSEDKVLGAIIINNKPYQTNEARKIINVKYEMASGQSYVNFYNYLKLLRGIKSIERYGR